MWDSLTRYPAGLFWLGLVFWIGQIAAIYLGIRAGRVRPPIGRVDYLLFGIAYTVLTFLAFGGMAWLGALIGAGGDFIIYAIPLFPIAYYFLARATVQRLIDIGWSPLWAWLLLLNKIATLFILVLLLVPGRRIKAVAARSA